MKDLVWCDPYKVNVEDVPEPKLVNKRDAIVRVTSTCICGSDLHLVDGFMPFMGLIRAGRIDPSFVVTHRLPLSQASEAYAMFREKRDGCVKVVLDPAA